MKYTPTQKEIVEILNAARTSGSVHLTGSREARKAQLQALRRKDLTEEGYQVVQQYIG
ncbi:MULTISPECIES: hypothetical protein [Enterobacteriaceae]|uniref:hypothetical protein n=1 Tax=Enterobacteriaceae TaxID=543 RepID=UPI002DBF63EB|nr:hypothetical protein [Klebsiella pneumoniae]MEC4383920.1 hypothetical protein [Klebsiella pneumoniae]HDO6787638.1 hypothetical protein [Klebsiella pneumoniae]